MKPMDDHTFRLLLSNVVVGLVFGATVAATGTSIAFCPQAWTFLRNQFRKGVRSPYKLFLGAGIFLSATGLAGTFINVLLILLGDSVVPLQPGAHLLAVGVATVCYVLMGSGYCLHLIAWHAVWREAGRAFPWLWGGALTGASLLGATAVWLYR